MQENENFNQNFKMKSLLILLACMAMVVYANKKAQFSDFMNNNKKSYPNKEEEDKRFEIFSKNIDKIESLNSELKDFKLGLNEFSDLTQEEFTKTKYGYKSIDDIQHAQRKKRQTTYVGKNFLDWRTLNRVSAVQNQKSCGSCWAFTAAGAIEGAWAAKYGQLLNVSDQNILDCDQRGDCNGGHMINAFIAIIKKGGINSESSYPYLNYDQRSCKYKSSISVAKISSYIRLASYDEAALEKAVTEKGPVAVAVCASDYWSSYKSGVMTSTFCDCPLNHGVLVVGYSNEDSPKYWIVKNSWGTTWGESGYIRIEKGNNACGIAIDASYPIA